MNFILQTPSLQHLAGIKTVAALWNQPDILKLIAELSEEIEEDDVEWKAVEEKVESQALVLELTQPCKQRLLKLIKPLGREILVWCCNQYIFYEDNHDSPLLRCLLPRTFSWTMHGVIDYAKTAQLMTKDDSLTIDRQYEIACMNCLEDEARELFPLVPEAGRLEYINTSLDADSANEHPDLVVYFSCALSGNAVQLTRAFQQLLSRGFSLHRHLFINSLFNSNRATIVYFFNKLQPGEKELMLRSYMARSVIGACRDRPRCNFLYYLSRMNETQQMGMFRECTSDVLICLLGWPMQSLFMEAVKCGWRYMLPNDYAKVLSAILRKISDACQDYNYSQLFRECWRLSPTAVKRRLLDDAEFLESLNETREKEIIKLLFREALSHQITALIDKWQEKFQTLLDESSIPGAVLMEWKEKAALNDKEDKRMRWEIIRLIDMKMESGKKRRL